MEKKMYKKKKTILIAIILVFLLTAALDNRLKIVYYKLETDKISNPLRLALITDLHSCRYGENEQKLAAAINAQKPDILMFVGDIFDDQISDANTEALLSAVAADYPCYYVTGNHEYWRGTQAFNTKMQILADYNVKRLATDTDTITINEETINICGVDDPDAYRVNNTDIQSGIASFQKQIVQLNKLNTNGNYTILLTHRPEYFQFYTKQSFDLVLCGHAHGGQWRLPGLINGIYAPNQGFLPKYAGGQYQENDTTMIVSRGLARESTRIPRIFNRPELVIIDLT